VIGGERVLAIIPARGGSKSVRLKNLHPLGGKPLLAWAIKAAQAVPEIDRILVSTDHDGIAAEARHRGAEVIDRPAELASDTALVADVLRHHLGLLRGQGEEARYLLLLEPTAPFRLPRDLRACLLLMHEQGFDSAATFSEAALNPHRAWRIEAGVPEVFIQGAVPWTPRQKLPPAYMLNGLVYGLVIDRLPPGSPAILFGRIGAVLSEPERSLDIDDTRDFMVANALLDQGHLPLA
jgi:CMP-N,N'-diacetyllegionaminic acid synthase